MGQPFVQLSFWGACADTFSGMTENSLDTDALLMQFNRLIQELLRGAMNRNTFRPWEI